MNISKSTGLGTLKKNLISRKKLFLAHTLTSLLYCTFVFLPPPKTVSNPHRMLIFFFLSFQALPPTMVIVGIYCGVIAAMFVLLKTVNYRLHHALDEGEVVEHQAKESQGSRGGTEGASDGGVTRREDSNGPG